MIEQISFESFGTNDFAENPEPRLPCVLLLDTSGSMAGAPIKEMNAGLAAYRDALAADPLAAKRVEIAVVSFGGEVELVCDFTTVEAFHPPRLTAKGETPMGAAILMGLDMLRRRKDEYKAHGLAYFRPWIFLITDGGPTDKPTWRTACEQVKQGEESKGFSFFAVGVEGANFEMLDKTCIREPLKLKGVQFRDLFLWLSASQTAVSRSTPGEAVPLTDPTGPKGWASV